MPDIETFTDLILDDYPNCPVAQARAIATYSIEKGFFHQGKVPEHPIKAAVISYVRHVFTDYDERVNKLNKLNGSVWTNKNEARFYVSDDVSAKLKEWRKQDIRTTTKFHKRGMK